MIPGAIIGLLVGIGTIVLARRQARQGTGVPGQIIAAMRGRPPMRFREIAAAVELDRFLGRGKVGQAIYALMKTGQVRRIDAPDAPSSRKRHELAHYQLVEPGATTDKP